MSINIAICEDKQVILNNLRTSIEKILKQNSIDGRVSIITGNPRHILEYAKQYVQGINVYFLDINLGTSMNGLELAKQIRSNDPNCYITFITGHPELCMTVFKYHIEAFEYLIKPVTYQALEECVVAISKYYARSLNFQKQNKNAMIKIKSGSCEYNLELQDIIYVESVRQKLVIHTHNHQIEFFGYLKDIINDLNKGGEFFYRCHRSYIININYVKEVNYRGSFIIMSNGDKCFMSRKQKAEMKEILDRMVRNNDICV